MFHIEIFLATLWLFYGLSMIMFAPRKYADARCKKLVRVFGWAGISLSLLMYITHAVELHARYDRAAMIIFYALMSLPILFTGACFIYHSVIGDKRARRLCWAFLLFCISLSALVFALNVILRLKP